MKDLIEKIKPIPVDKFWWNQSYEIPKREGELFGSMADTILYIGSVVMPNPSYITYFIQRK